nr:MAG TPA: hypothetical protein [Caudoviricetes sp.]
MSFQFNGYIVCYSLFVNVIHCHIPGTSGSLGLLESATNGSPLYTYCFSVVLFSFISVITKPGYKYVLILLLISHALVSYNFSWFYTTVRGSIGAAVCTSKLYGIGVAPGYLCLKFLYIICVKITLMH